MSELIALARELGTKLQTQPEYLKYQLALQANEEDEDLSGKMEAFEQLNRELGAERQKPEPDTERLKELDHNLRGTYDAIMSNVNMLNFTAATEEFKTTLDFVNQIISGSAQGLAPQTIQLESGCPSGGCGGCHAE